MVMSRIFSFGKIIHNQRKSLNKNISYTYFQKLITVLAFNSLLAEYFRIHLQYQSPLYISSGQAVLRFYNLETA